MQALYLPWAMLALDVVFGNSPVPGLLGILVGHTYYFLTAVYPRQSGGTELLRTPKFVYPLFNTRTICSSCNAAFAVCRCLCFPSANG